MMELVSNLWASESFIIALKSSVKKEVICELVDFLFEKHADSVGNLSKEDVYGAILQREYDFATGLGQGLAFPHARIPGWGNLAVVAGISKEGIDFSSVDNRPAHCVFLMISSTDEPYMILQAMSAVLRDLKDRVDMEEIARGNITAKDIVPILKGIRVDPLEKIRVGHIACPVTTTVSKDMPLSDLARLMHESRVDILPVVDEKNVFCGEVSCQDVFAVGMPDFFNQLKTISFIKYLDPFEKLFSLEKELRVKDIFRSNCSVMTTENTLMEVIFEMTVRKRSKLFVVEEDGKLLGVIDRFTIIDKILFT